MLPIELSFFKEEYEFPIYVFRNSERTSLLTVWLIAGVEAGHWEMEREATGLAKKKYLDLVLTRQICESREQQCVEAINED